MIVWPVSTSAIRTAVKQVIGERPGRFCPAAATISSKSLGRDSRQATFHLSLDDHRIDDVTAVIDGTKRRTVIAGPLVDVDLPRCNAEGKAC